jgi:hypothetical protein
MSDYALDREYAGGQEEQVRLIERHPERTADDWAADLVILTARLDRISREKEQLEGRRDVLARHVAKGGAR